MIFKNINELLDKIDPIITNNNIDKYWVEEAKKLIINNFEKNIDINELLNRISDLNIVNEKENCIKANALSILKKYISL